MPELPEVETIKLGLQRKIVGLTIKKIQVLNSKTFQAEGSERTKRVEGKKVLGVWRRAKMLGIDLGVEGAGPAARQPHASPTSLTSEGPPHGAPRLTSPALTLLFHLKMTGQLIYDPSTRLRASRQRIIGGHPTPDMRNTMPNSHTRVIFEFSDQSKLYFNDQRKFGWVKLVNRKSLIVNRLLQKLGPEPLEDTFTWEALKQNLLKHQSQPIKVTIMDQSVVSGVGNIYASEALFDAKIDPRRKVQTLSDKDFQALFAGIRVALRMGIKHGGSSKAHFVDSEGKKGYFLDYAKVYGKEGYKCHGCSGKVQKIQQAGRGTYYCPTCQR